MAKTYRWHWSIQTPGPVDTIIVAIPKAKEGTDTYLNLPSYQAPELVNGDSGGTQYWNCNAVRPVQEIKSIVEAIRNIRDIFGKWL